MNYFGIDWLATGFALLAAYKLGNEDPRGFQAFVVANICWMVVGVLASSPAIVFGNLSFLLINLRGWTRWQRKGSMA